MERGGSCVDEVLGIQDVQSHAQPHASQSISGGVKRTRQPLQTCVQKRRKMISGRGVTFCETVSLQYYTKESEQAIYDAKPEIIQLNSPGLCANPPTDPRNMTWKSED